MATRIEAIAAYRPRIEYNQTIDTETIAEYITRGTSLNVGEILNVLREFNGAIIFYACQGFPIKLDDLGIFRPSLNLDGDIAVRLSADPSIRKKVNAKNAFQGRKINAANEGMSVDELVALWNGDHPDDPVEESGSGS